jgi:hypothetical protein
MRRKKRFYCQATFYLHYDLNLSESVLTKREIRFDRNFLLQFLLIFLGVVCVYEPVLTHCYAHTDDYPGIYNYNYFPGGPFEQVWLANGRPLMGLQIWAMFKRVSQPEGLWKVRGIGLIEIALCGLALFRLYRTKQWPIWESGAIALLIILTPAFGVYAGWATTVPVPLAALLALLSGWRALDEWGNFPNGKSVTCVIVVATGLLLSECGYQPAAGFFLLPAIIQASRNGYSANDLRILRRCLIIFVIVLAGYYIGYQICVKLFLAGNPVTARGGICTQPMERIKFLAEQPGLRLFTLWGALSKGFWQWIIGWGVAGLFGAGAVDYILRCERGARFWAVILPPVCFLLIVSPLLVAKDSYAPFRTLAAAYAFVLHFAALGLRAAGARYKIAAKKWTMIFVWGTPTLICGLAAHHWVWRGLVRPNERELASYRRYLNLAAAFPPKKIFFSYPTAAVGGFSEMPQVEEYGLYSSWLDWVPKPMLTMLLCEEFGETFEKTVRESPANPVVTIVSEDFVTTNKMDLRIDGTRVLRGLHLAREIDRKK